MLIYAVGRRAVQLLHLMLCVQKLFVWVQEAKEQSNESTKCEGVRFGSKLLLHR